MSPLPITLTVALHFHGRRVTGIKDAIKHFNSWKDMYKFVRNNGFDKTHTMIISNLVLSKRRAEQVLKVEKNRGYWIVEMHEK